MKFWTIVLLLAIALAMGCQPFPPVPTPISPPTVAPTPDNGNVALSDGADTINAVVGQEFTITLNSNRTTPYQWQLAKPLNEVIVKLVGSRYDGPGASAPPGRGGKEVWTFLPVGPGKTEVALNYVRLGEKDAPPAGPGTYMANRVIRVIVADKGDSPGTGGPTTGQGAGPAAAADKYLFIEEWLETYESPRALMVDFPDYRFEKDTGWLKPWLAPRGRLFPLEELSGLKLVYGTGQSRTGSAGGGIASRVVAVTELPFTKGNVVVEKFDAEGIAYLIIDGEKVILRPSQSWQKNLRKTIEGVGDELSRYRITNYGLQDKSRIQLLNERK